jgi:hypothetical protein
MRPSKECSNRRLVSTFKFISLWFLAGLPQTRKTRKSIRKEALARNQHYYFWCPILNEGWPRIQIGGGRRPSKKCSRQPKLSVPYGFIGFGDIHGTKPYKFIGFGDIHGPKPYKFIWFGDIQAKAFSAGRTPRWPPTAGGGSCIPRLKYSGLGTRS